MSDITPRAPALVNEDVNNWLASSSPLLPDSLANNCNDEDTSSLYVSNDWLASSPSLPDSVVNNCNDEDTSSLYVSGDDASPLLVHRDVGLLQNANNQEYTPPHINNNWLATSSPSLPDSLMNNCNDEDTSSLYVSGDDASPLPVHRDVGLLQNADNQEYTPPHINGDDASPLLPVHRDVGLLPNADNQEYTPPHITNDWLASSSLSSPDSLVNNCNDEDTSSLYVSGDDASPLLPVHCNVRLLLNANIQEYTPPHVTDDDASPLLPVHCNVRLLQNANNQEITPPNVTHSSSKMPSATKPTDANIDISEEYSDDAETGNADSNDPVHPYQHVCSTILSFKTWLNVHAYGEKELCSECSKVFNDFRRDIELAVSRCKNSLTPVVPRSERQSIEESPKAPALLAMCIREVELRGLGSIGIYSSVTDYDEDVDELMENLLDGSVEPSDVEDIYTISGCVVQILYSFEEPLVPKDKWEEFVSLAKLSEEARDVSMDVKLLVNGLPPDNRDTLVYLIQHLQLVTGSPSCDLDIETLAEIFGPVIVGYGTMSKYDPRAANGMNDVMQMFLRQSSDCWVL